MQIILDLPEIHSSEELFEWMRSRNIGWLKPLDGWSAVCVSIGREGYDFVLQSDEFELESKTLKAIKKIITSSNCGDMSIVNEVLSDRD